MRADDVLDADLRARLAARYGDPPRSYHTFEHAADVARRAAELGGDRPCLLAAWFHDAVYVPGAGDNERRSAELLRSWLEDDPDVARAATLVQMTADHRPPAGDGQAARLSDADLAVLGGSEEQYAAYATAVRREFAALDAAAWRTGRAAVLRDLLGREMLFHTAVGRARWEEGARRNLTRELARLTAGDDRDDRR